MMSRLLATCAALAVTALVTLPAPAANAADRNASLMKTAPIEVSSARRHYRHHVYRRYYGPRYGYYGGPYYGYDAYAYSPYYRPAPYVGFGIGPFGFGIW